MVYGFWFRGLVVLDFRVYCFIGFRNIPQGLKAFYEGVDRVLCWGFKRFRLLQF